MKKDKDLISYISLWCGARNEKSPYQFNLCFISKLEKVEHRFYFESEIDMLKAKDYLQKNNCLVQCFNKR